MLSVRNLWTGYGPIEIVRGASLDIYAGEYVALIGWSGSGKTTFMKTIAGLLVPSAGHVLYCGRDITALPAHCRVGQGIAMVPEGRHLFNGMTVYENILVGAHTISDARALDRQVDFVFELFSTLRERRNQIAGTLSGGEQQMCAIARALISAPQLLLIDELSLGLAPVVVSRLVEALAALRRLGMTMILVEQDAALALSIADRAYIMERGQITRMATSADLKMDPQIQREYFGQSVSL